VFVVVTQRQWALRRLRSEVREEALPILKPSGEGPASQAKCSPARLLNPILEQLRCASTPLKIEVAMWENIPQTTMQLLFLHIYGGSSFTTLGAAVGLVNIFVTVVAPPILLRCAPKMVYASRHLAASPWAGLRETAAMSIDCMDREAWSDVDAVVRDTVPALLAAVREDAALRVGVASALVLIRHAVDIREAGAHDVAEAVRFLCKTKDVLGDKFQDAFIAMVALMESETIFGQLDGVSGRIIYFVGSSAASLDTSLTCRAILALHRVCSRCPDSSLEDIVEKELKDIEAHAKEAECRDLAGLVRRACKTDSVKLAIDRLTSALEGCGSEYHSRVLVQLLSDRRGEVPVFAAEGCLGVTTAFISAGDRMQAFDVLVRAVGDESVDVDTRVQAAKAIATKRVCGSWDLPPAVGGALKTAMTESAELEIRAAAAEALCSIGTPRISAEDRQAALSVLASAASDSNPDEDLRMHAAAALWAASVPPSMSKDDVSRPAVKGSGVAGEEHEAPRKPARPSSVEAFHVRTLLQGFRGRPRSSDKERSCERAP